MALLGHSIVEAGLARLSGLWPQVSRPANLRLKLSHQQKSDSAALAAANAIYAGHTALTAESFSDLSWLQHFAQSGRQLLMCHALMLLEGWNRQPQSRADFHMDKTVLQRLTKAAAPFAAALDADALLPLSTALQNRVRRFMALSVSDTNDKLSKALTLLDVADVLDDGASLQKEAARLLDHGLPLLIADDGGPLGHNLQDYALWIDRILDAESTPLHPQTLHALDRARPFLAMLLNHDQTYCFHSSQKPHPTICATTPMQLAPGSAVARLQAGKSVIICWPSPFRDQTETQISSQGQRLLTCGGFMHNTAEPGEPPKLSVVNSNEGQLLQQTSSTTERSIFMSPKGDDLRIEDILPGDGLTRWMQLRINPTSKFSIARNGTTATIAGDGRNVWQLTLRGARILPNHMCGEFLMETTGQHRRVNWALKRVMRDKVRSAKSEMPELPF